MSSLLPTLSKTWQFAENQVIAANASRTTQTQNLLHALKTQWKAWSAAAMTVVGSNDGTTASATDAVDRWSSAGVISTNGWLILRQTGFGWNQDILIHVTNIATSAWAVWVSSGAGFTGGNTTTRPTATDEVQVTDVSSSICGAPANTQQILNMAQSTDGQSIRVWVYAANLPIGVLIIDKLKDPVPGFTKPWVGAKFGGSGAATAVTYALVTQNNWAGYHAGAITFRPSSEAVDTASGTPAFIGNNATAQVANEISGGFPMPPMGMICTTTTKRGRHGDLFDLWLGSTLVIDGDSYPGASESPLHQFAEVGPFVMPFKSGTVPLTA